MGFINFKFQCRSKSCNSFETFNRSRAIWPKGYQRGGLGKSHQNGDVLKQGSGLVALPQASALVFFRRDSMQMIARAFKSLFSLLTKMLGNV